MINIQGLNVLVGGFQLHDINLTVEDSRYGVILGPSGAGKTLFLETIVGLYKPDAGKVLIGGNDVTSYPPEIRNMAYVPQDMTLFPHINVYENICFGAHAHKIPQPKMKDRLDKLTSLLDISHLLGRSNPMTLSHGEQQRVAIARALMISPRAIILDEPFSALDALLRRELQLQLRQINKELKVTILHVTHDREEAFMLGDKIAIMIGGMILQVGNREDLYYKPSTIEVARFLLNQNIFKGEIESLDEQTMTLALSDGSTRLQALRSNGLRPGDQAYFGIRPEDIMVIRPGKKLGDSVRANLMVGKVEIIMEKGSSLLILVKVPELENPLELDIPNAAFRNLDLETGKTVQISLKMKSIWNIPKGKNEGASM